MNEYRFRLIVGGSFKNGVSDDDLLGATDALGDAGCDDCSISARDSGLELEFERAHRSLQDAIASAIHQVEQAGYVVEMVQIDRDAALPISSS